MSSTPAEVQEVIAQMTPQQVQDMNEAMLPHLEELIAKGFTPSPEEMRMIEDVRARVKAKLNVSN